MDATAANPVRSSPFTGWAAGVALAVVIALAPLLVVQYRQYKLLNDTVRFQVDSVLWMAFQLEREHVRLRTAMEGVVDRHQVIEPAALNLRYEIFLSRKDLLHDNTSVQELRNAEEYGKAMTQLDAFVRAADPVFARVARGQAAVADLVPLLAMARTQEAAVADLSLRANNAVDAHLDERNRTIRQQGLLVILLAAIQAVILLAFVGMLILYIRRQHQQNRELHELTTHLQAARAEAEAANAGKSVFLANMSHEIRTPFQGLLGMLNLLDDSSLSSRQRDYVQTARDSAQHLLGILNDILDVSTMESGTLTLTLTPVRLAEVISEVHSLMRVAAADKGLALTLNLSPGLPKWVNADATRLRQILFNLINNAIKFTVKGSIEINVQVRQVGVPAIEVSIRDTGPGMDEQTLQNLFARFYQADASVKRRYGGTGLGLEISRNLARMMGGDISVVSAPGAGSTFTVVLPLEEVSAPEQSTQPAPLGETRLRVLAAEDHPINLKYMSILLEKMGHDAVFCENGQEAVELLMSQPFDVVLMDLHMPVMDGLTATRTIRALGGAASQVKIILVTADVVNDTREQAVAAGVDAFAAKPLQMEDLRRALRHCGLQAVQSDGDGQVTTNFFPVSQYDVPVELPQPSDLQPMNYVDGPVFREIVAMMPEETLRELLQELFNHPAGAVNGLLSVLPGTDREAIGLAAHKLKGTAMLLGLKAIVKTAGTLEHIARRTQASIDLKLVDQLGFEILQTREALAMLGIPVLQKAAPGPAGTGPRP